MILPFNTLQEQNKEMPTNIQEMINEKDQEETKLLKE